MTLRKSSVFAAALLAPGLFFASIGHAQTANPSSSTDETVQLNPFLVQADSTGRYQINESASGSRIKQNVMDSSTTMDSVSRDLIDDIGAGQTLQAARYVAGVTDSTIPNALDRITIRGFQTDGQRIDGFTYEGQAAYDLAGIDHIEVIKGPNALLLPSGTPGGTINQVAKSPLFTEQGYVTVQAGQYDADRIEGDVTGPINNQLAYRFVTAYQDSRGYIERAYRDSLLVSPSFTWRPASNAQLTVHFEYYNFRASSADGVPIDYSRTGTATDFYSYPGIPLDYSIAMNGEYREERREATWFLFTSKISDRLSVRLAGRASQVSGPTLGFGFGPNSNDGAVNPATGFWTPGITYTAAPNFTPTVGVPATSWTHTGTYQTNIYRREDLQNDYVYEFDVTNLKTTTLGGFAYGYYSNNRVSTNGTAPAVANPFNPATYNWNVDPSTIVWAATNTNQQLRYSQYQLYATESADLFNNKVILNAGVANFSFNGYIVNKIGTGTPLTPGSGDTNTVNYGVVVKPVPNVALYYGHSENAAPTTSFNTVATGGVPVFSIGKDDEAGIKAQLLDGRLFGMVDYYSILQTAYGIGNPLNNTSPPPPVLLPTLYSTRIARGWEYQMTGEITKQLSMIANFTNFMNVDPNGVPFRTTAERSGGVYLHYLMTDGMLKGFSAGVGVNYMSKSPGNSASGYTALGLPIQPQFYYPAHTVADLNFDYTRGHVVYRLNVFNVTNQTYWDGGGSQTNNDVANPRNVTGSVTYKF